MKWHIQLSRYAVVGVAINAAGYLLYLLATSLGTGPKTTMSFLYLLGVLNAFFLNKTWSFRFVGAAGPAFVRYATLYVLGYIINILTFLLLVDQVRLPHQWVMAGLALFMPVFFFAGQKFWVFRQNPIHELRG